MNTTFRWLAGVFMASLLISPAFAVDGKADEKADDKSATTKPIVAVFRLRAPIVETPVDETLSLFGSGHQPTSLKDLVVRLAKARDDQAVKAVVLLMENADLGKA